MLKLTLKILEIKAFNEYMLMLVIEDSMYAQWVPIQLRNIAHWQSSGFDQWKRNITTKYKIEMK